jgi:GNAT superfamily N-acetyltransferase
MANVRQATIEDVTQLVKLGRLMHAEAPALNHASYDEDKVRAAITLAVQGGGVFVHETDGEIDGGFAGMIVERWFSTDRYATDLALFVRQDRRGGFIACRVLDAFIAWCARQGVAARDVVIGVSTGVRAWDTGRLYERLGFECIGGIYRLREY